MLVEQHNKAGQRGRQRQHIRDAAAAFAALVANDIVSPSAFATNPAQAMVPFAAAAVVVVVARKTGSLIWCAIVGMVAYALLTMVI